MSKAINVQSGHYKVAGRSRPGDDILQEQQKRAYTGQRKMVRVAAAEDHAGVPVWESTPPNLEAEARPARSKRARRKGTGAKSPHSASAGRAPAKGKSAKRRTTQRAPKAAARSPRARRRVSGRK